MNLLLALVKHYDTLENQDKSKVPPFGWTNAKAHFAVELNDDGSIDDIPCPRRTRQEESRRGV